MELAGRLTSRSGPSPVSLAGPVTAPDSAVRVLVVHTQEEWEVACESYRVASATPPSVHPEG